QQARPTSQLPPPPPAVATELVDDRLVVIGHVADGTHTTPGKLHLMANPALNDKRFEAVRDEWEPGWAAPGSGGTEVADGAPPPTVRTGVMTANGTFAKTFVLFLLVLAGGAVGWSQVTIGPTDRAQIPGWTG